MARRVTGDGPVVFLHAHPDDEAIFTGGTMALLADAGVPTVLVVATGGELGAPMGSPGEPVAGSAETALGEVRRAEAEAAARQLGVGRVEFLGYRDSGMAGDPGNDAPGSFWAAPLDEAADRLASLLSDIGASTVVGYDDGGIYGHPDHLKVATVARRSAELIGLESRYAATVDREHLHFVETHVVEEAALGGDLGLVRSRIGVASVEVSTTIDVTAVLERKRSAMAAHASQMPEAAAIFGLPDARFADVYGIEWYLREGPPGILDRLGTIRTP